VQPERWILTDSMLRDALERVRSISSGQSSMLPELQWALARPHLPAYYDDCCRRHYLAVRLRFPDTCWDDVAPLYAMIAAIHQPGVTKLPASCARALETHFPILRGGSRLDWPQASQVFEEIWGRLTSLLSERQPEAEGSC
jgi:hypothetical protein